MPFTQFDCHTFLLAYKVRKTIQNLALASTAMFCAVDNKLIKIPRKTKTSHQSPSQDVFDVCMKMQLIPLAPFAFSNL